MRVWIDLKYVTKRSSGLYYYRRRIPEDLRQHHKNLVFFVQSLKTKDLGAAEALSKRITSSLDHLWAHFRNPHETSLPNNLRDRATALLDSFGFSPGGGNKVVADHGGSEPLTALEVMLDLYEPKLDGVRYEGQAHTEETKLIEEALNQLGKGRAWHWQDAMDLHKSLTGDGKSKNDINHIERPIKRLIEVLGDKPLSDYTRQDAIKYRDWLYDASDARLRKSPLSTSSVKRSLDSVNSVFNLMNQEYSLGLQNPFSGMRFRKQEAVRRPPIPVKEIVKIQRLCRQHDDDMRWLIAMISDTGMRLGEAAGLEVSHIHLNEEIPYLTIEETDNRRLKTKTSRRRIPLVGAALWAATRAVEAAKAHGSQFLFPRYNKKSSTNSNSASNGLNKWMKEHIAQQYVIHGFRHAMRDRLREVDCPSDVMDEVGGWSKLSVGQAYGQGSSIERLHGYMSKVVLD